MFHLAIFQMLFFFSDQIESVAFLDKVEAVMVSKEVAKGMKPSFVCLTTDAFALSI